MVIPLVYRFISLTTHVDSAVVTAPLDILRRHATILSTNRRSGALGFVRDKLSTKSQGVSLIVDGLFRQVPLRSVIQARGITGPLLELR